MKKTNKREILKSTTHRSKLRGIRRFSRRISGHSSLNTATSCGVLDPARNKLNKKELIDEITRNNEIILNEFMGRMRGVIYNRYDKSKGFQFAMLDKNYNELMDLVYLNNQFIRKYL